MTNNLLDSSYSEQFSAGLKWITTPHFSYLRIYIHYQTLFFQQVVLGFAHQDCSALPACLFICFHFHFPAGCQAQYKPWNTRRRQIRSQIHSQGFPVHPPATSAPPAPPSPSAWLSISWRRACRRTLSFRRLVYMDSLLARRLFLVPLICFA